MANAVTDGLRTQEIEVLTTPEAEHLGWSDEQHLTFARDNKYVFVTQDDDFLTLARRVDHAGIAYCKPQTRSVKEILHSLFAFYENASPEEMFNAVRFL